jgi:2-dehydro-3-deoxy-D-gluconate 5-dehydrogenase
MQKLFSNKIFDLTGKKALITGAGSGIGQAIAFALAGFGADVFVVSRKYEKAVATAEKIGVETERKAYPYSLDQSKMDGIEAMVNEAVSLLGGLDILVNSAGMNIRKEILDITEEDWDPVQTVNLKAVLFTCKAAAKHMTKQKSGKIINISSISCLLGHPARGAYAASKGGLIQITKVMSTEWAPYNINVNAISPAAIDTPFIDGLKKDRARLDRELERIPLGRIGQPEDITGAAVFLASNSSDFITGQNLFIEGGRIVD